MAPEVPSRWMYIALASLGSNRARASRASQPSKASPPPVALSGWWLSVPIPYRNRHEAPVGAPVGCGTAHAGRCPLRSGGWRRWRRWRALVAARGCLSAALALSCSARLIVPGRPQVTPRYLARNVAAKQYPRGQAPPTTSSHHSPSPHLTSQPTHGLIFSSPWGSILPPFTHTSHLTLLTLPHPPSCSNHAPAFPQLKSVMDAFHCPRQSITDPGRASPRFLKPPPSPPSRVRSSLPQILPYLSSTEQPLPRNSQLTFA